MTAGPCDRAWCDELHCLGMHCGDDDHKWVRLSSDEWDGYGIDAVQYIAVWHECHCGAVKEMIE